MSPYLDAGFLFTLLVRTNGSADASIIVREIERPCLITELHHFQARTFLAQTKYSPQTVHQHAARQGLRLWQWFLDEGILEVCKVDWNAAFQSSIDLVIGWSEAPPAPLLILHPVLASHSGATHFLSFDPRSRVIAKKLGLKLLPERL